MLIVLLHSALRAYPQIKDWLFFLSRRSFPRGEVRCVKKEDLRNFVCLLGIGATPDSHRSKSRQRGGGRKPTYSNRLYFSAMVYVLRTGIIWNALPCKKFGGMSSSALHNKFQQWSIAGVFTKIWQRGLAEYDEIQGITWTWQAADSASIEALLYRESTGPNPTDREKKAQNDMFSSTRVASPSRYSSAQPTSMTAWLWSLYSRRPSFHRQQQQNATCAWMQGTLVKRKSPSAMASSPSYAHEERKRRRSQPIPGSRRNDGSLKGHTPGSIAFES